MIQVLVQTPMMVEGLRRSPLPTLTPGSRPLNTGHHPGKYRGSQNHQLDIRRKLLVFLAAANLVVYWWLEVSDFFGPTPAIRMFYGPNLVYQTVQQGCLPFAKLYRFQSAVALINIWKSLFRCEVPPLVIQPPPQEASFVGPAGTVGTTSLPHHQDAIMTFKMLPPDSSRMKQAIANSIMKQEVDRANLRLRRYLSDESSSSDFFDPDESSNALKSPDKEMMIPRKGPKLSRLVFL